jgi:hypothetical protein
MAADLADVVDAAKRHGHLKLLAKELDRARDATLT